MGEGRNLFLACLRRAAEMMVWHGFRDGHFAGV